MAAKKNAKKTAKSTKAPILLGEIRPFNGVYKDRMMPGLISAYRGGEDVLAVVALDGRKDGLGVAGVTGSHRLAAMVKVFGADAPIDPRYVTVIDLADVDAVFRDQYLHPEVEMCATRHMLWGACPEAVKYDLSSLYEVIKYDFKLSRLIDEQE